MHEAATCQIKAELGCRKKETRIHLEEAQQEYDSQSTGHLCYLHFSKLISIQSILSLFYNVSFSMPFPDFPPGETLHDLVALTQHGLAKLKPIEKIGRNYI